MRALLVVDVQTDVMKGRNTKGLIEACNDTIGRYAPKNVVSNLLFDKKRSNAFSNPGLLRALRDMGADEVEIIGIDGNHCVKATALGALTNGIGATVNVRAVVSRNEAAFEKTKRRLRAAGVELANG